MKISDFNNTLLYSNKNVEKIARKLINESCNAVLMEMFDDKCILADHKTGQIYEAAYSFDGKVFTLDNFEPITLERENNQLKEAISNYFDDSTVDLAEAYEEASDSSSAVFESSLTEALASKSFDKVIDYSELSGINEEIGDVKESNTFKLYEERLSEKPTNSIKVINWKDPVKVSLIDEDENLVVNKNASAKAKVLKSDVNFRSSIKEAATEMLNGNTDIMEALLEKNPCIVALDKAGLKELVGLSVLSNKTLAESRSEIVKGIESIISENEFLSEKKSVLKEAEENEDEAAEDAPEASKEDVEGLKAALEKAKEKTSDEKLISKIDDIISSISDASDAGETDVKAVKEAVELLRM